MSLNKSRKYTQIYTNSEIFYIDNQDVSWSNVEELNVLSSKSQLSQMLDNQITGNQMSVNQIF